ncbi:MAG: transcriptional repressor [Dehalococcoidales bacterium]|nr:transcriptional repressor [Dehalococcoidales bacterium]
MSCEITLKKKGFRLTPQRRMIIGLIHKKTGHLSAEEIIRHVQKKMPGVNKSTIYRTLELLEQNGCVYKSEMDNSFIYHHAEEGHHHHLLCSKCGKTIVCEENIFSPVEEYLLQNHGFQVEFKHVIIHGICRNCK